MRKIHARSTQRKINITGSIPSLLSLDDILNEVINFSYFSIDQWVNELATLGCFSFMFQ